METLNELTMQRSESTTAGTAKECCGHCAEQTNSQHAHCGRKFTLKKGLPGETGIIFSLTPATNILLEETKLIF